MLKTKTLHWIFTGLFAAMMLFSAVPDIILTPEAIKFITHLGYPVYFIVFIGIAKALGAIAIVIPGYPRIKEWAYAGLFYDLIAAVYSGIATDGLMIQMTFMLLPFGLGIGSYMLYHKKLVHGK
jgi:DoxX-like family